MSDSQPPIFIVGLRRSGTTIFWEILRQDRQFRCFDEPFNPKLAQLPNPHPKGTWDEFIELYQADPERFRQCFAPVTPEQEPEEELTDAQAAYLRWLMGTAPRTLFDFTRCHFKLAALHRLAPEAVLVHLYRAPQAVASSHLLPSGRPRTMRQRLDWIYRRAAFFRRRIDFNNWQFQQVMSRALEEPLATHLRSAGLDPQRVVGLPAAGKIMAYWKASHDYVERVGPELFGDRFVSLSFESFSVSPHDALRRLYGALRETPPESLDLSRLRPASAGYRPGDLRWRRLMDQLDLVPQSGG